MELLHLNNVSTGCILLGGLFVYDVFWVSSRLLLRKRWQILVRNVFGAGVDRTSLTCHRCLFLQVFGTNVMVTVARSFEAPIKCKDASDSLRRRDARLLTLWFLCSGFPSGPVGERPRSQQLRHVGSGRHRHPRNLHRPPAALRRQVAPSVLLSQSVFTVR